jgi:hypothetical protein
VTVLLTAGAAVLMSGCDSFKFCHHHAHGDPPTSNILIGFVCIGYCGRRLKTGPPAPVEN